jgi:glutamine cyclotransferase
LGLGSRKTLHRGYRVIVNGQLMLSWTLSLIIVLGLPIMLNPMTVLSLITVASWTKPVMRRLVVVLVLVSSVSSLACQPGTVANLPDKKTPNNEAVSLSGYEVVHSWPHDPHAFTQGLVFHDGKLLESTGEQGRSSLRRVELETGQVVQKVDVPEPYFAEGLTLLKGKLYQLTWQHQLGFIYDAWTFDKIGQFNYQGEGWGLTNDGKSLILSDGTHQIRYLDPDNFQLQRTIAVVDNNGPVKEINELEYVHGEIYANIWHEDRIVRIDPQTGRILGWIDLKGLLKPGEVSDPEAVLNGIAYDDASGRLFVTGKLWPKLFEIRVTQK